MTPTDFPEAKFIFGAPTGMTEAQVQPIPAFHGQVTGGDLDGMDVVIVAWKPDEQDMEILKRGGLVYLACYGGLPPHRLSTQFGELV